MAIPATSAGNPGEITASDPLRPLLVIVLVAKVMVSVFLLAAVSFVPPVTADPGYLAVLGEEGREQPLFSSRIPL